MRALAGRARDIRAGQTGPRAYARTRVKHLRTTEHASHVRDQWLADHLSRNTHWSSRLAESSREAFLSLSTQRVRSSNTAQFF